MTDRPGPVRFPPCAPDRGSVMSGPLARPGARRRSSRESLLGSSYAAVCPALLYFFTFFVPAGGHPPGWTPPAG
ncbi:hypothetical protein CRV15_17410 [Streptomyces clavuligerus]|uniref:Uncharacterized protein n=1 Tax=Streptomyces clavuligerus TaxID=1901 RepID=B5GZN6_STRCL|nr:hypothetical protein D1794_18055 [Streptomyces clavuligerus]EDY51782.1 hypothetical protein SSCG_04853 [Streptomyces clavuligerus]EFG07288.1 Hypothetical protein SCLAV_2215 [Streptomyces clavuligerus]QCS07238.1 hypothetical protein CRV15_17410 [Streptomyces clavuligerus]QPJ93412.1 hypothetical protein GE265_10650 [Streptomyces clavuligerus]